MNLHNEIMNIRVDNKLKEGYTDVDGEVSSNWYSYKEGHRDARHAAAELCIQAEARIEDLETALKKAREDINWMLNSEKLLSPFVFDYIDKALEDEK